MVAGVALVTQHARYVVTERMARNMDDEEFGRAYAAALADVLRNAGVEGREAVVFVVDWTDDAEPVTNVYVNFTEDFPLAKILRGVGRRVRRRLRAGVLP